MAQRKIPYLKVVEPPENPKQLKKAERKVRWKKWEGAVSILILAVLAICGTYLLLDNKTYGTAREAASYTKEISDTSNYVQFASVDPADADQDADDRSKGECICRGRQRRK